MSMPMLPSDVLILIMQNCTIRELFALARTCRFFHTLVYEFGWSNYLRSNPRPSYSLLESRSYLDSYAQVKYNTLTDHAWSERLFIARPLSHSWSGKLQPTLAISSSRMIVAAGCTLYSYKYTMPTSKDDAPGLCFEASFTFGERQNAKQDITGITFIPDGGLNHTLYLGFRDGALERVSLSLPPKHAKDDILMTRSSNSILNFHGGSIIEELSCAGDSILSLSSNGTAALFDTSSVSPSPHFIDLQTQSWSSHLSVKSSTPYAAFGTSSVTPLSVHYITNSAISATPSAILYADAKHVIECRTSSAVYGISGAPPSSPWGRSDQVLISGWYDGHVRVHDLRSASRISHTSSSAGPTPLLPVLTLYDSCSYEPIYAVSCGGGSASHIAAGSARHSVVAFWDVRSPYQGWSVHAPGNDSSPVYSIHLESSRLFGVTQSRPFVYDFGPGVTHNTYPQLPTWNDGGLKRVKNTVGYYVTKYHHIRVCGTP